MMQVQYFELYPAVVFFNFFSKWAKILILKFLNKIYDEWGYFGFFIKKNHSPCFYEYVDVDIRNQILVHWSSSTEIEMWEMEKCQFCDYISEVIFFCEIQQKFKGWRYNKKWCNFVDFPVKECLSKVSKQFIINKCPSTEGIQDTNVMFLMFLNLRSKVLGMENWIMPTHFLVFIFKDWTFRVLGKNWESFSQEVGSLKVCNVS